VATGVGADASGLVALAEAIAAGLRRGGGGAAGRGRVDHKEEGFEGDGDNADGADDADYENNDGGNDDSDGGNDDDGDDSGDGGAGTSGRTRSRRSRHARKPGAYLRLRGVTLCEAELPVQSVLRDRRVCLADACLGPADALFLGRLLRRNGSLTSLDLAHNAVATALAPAAEAWSAAAAAAGGGAVGAAGGAGIHARLRTGGGGAGVVHGVRPGDRRRAGEATRRCVRARGVRPAAPLAWRALDCLAAALLF
jgi:hypothetical protein